MNYSLASAAPWCEETITMRQYVQ